MMDSYFKYQLLKKIQGKPKYELLETLLRKYKPIMIGKLIFAHAIAFHAILNLHYMKIGTVLYTIVLFILAALGITAGAHRLYTHRSYSAKWPLRVFLLICLTLSAQLSIRIWARIHRQHHKYTDTDSDPNNAKRGFFFTHIGWLMLEKTPECEDKTKEIDVSDIMMDPLARFHSKFFLVCATILLFLPAVIPVLYWGEDPILSVTSTGGLRFIMGFHVTMSVNSFAHTYGSRPYNKNCSSTDAALMSFFSVGEGWHNYHHTFPWDYKAGEFGDRMNLAARLIDLCSKLGLAYDLKSASPELIQNMKEKYGDGS